MTKTVDVRDAQAKLPELLSLALKGDDVIFLEGDKPVARLTRIWQTGQRRVPDLNKGEVWMSDDFDEPLPDDFWLGEE